VYRAAIVSFDEQRAVLVVMGEEDQLTCGRRRRALSLALKASRDVVVDLRGLRFADSSLMVDLAVLARRLRLNGRKMRLLGAQPQIQRLIEIMGLDRLPAVALELA
jgi:anti-anti-sigma factor